MTNNNSFHYLLQFKKKVILLLKTFWIYFFPLLAQTVIYFIIWGIFELLLKIPTYFDLDTPVIHIGDIEMPMDVLISKFLDIWVVAGVFAILIVYIIRVTTNFRLKDEPR